MEFLAQITAPIAAVAAIAIVAAVALLGFRLGRVCGRLTLGRGLLVRNEKNELTFEEKNGMPFVKLTFATEVFNLKRRRRYLSWRRFADDEHNEDLAAILKAWEYKAWLDFGIDGKISLEPSLTDRLGLLLYLPPWRTLEREELTVGEEFVCPLVERAQVSGTIAALKKGGVHFGNVIKFNNIETLANQDFMFCWGRIRQEKAWERVEHNAVDQALAHRRQHGGWGEDEDFDPLETSNPFPEDEAAEDHPIIKAARSRLNQPRSKKLPR